MPVQSFKKEIDGVTYEVTQFPADEGLRVLTQLVNVIGTSISHLVEGSKPKAEESTGSILDLDTNFEALGRAISALVMRLGEDQVSSLIFRMLATTRVWGEKGGAFGDPNGRTLFNNHFAGKLKSLVKLLFFVVEVNYGDFFGETDTGSLTDRIFGLIVSPAGSEKSTKD